MHTFGRGRCWPSAAWSSIAIIWCARTAFGNQLKALARSEGMSERINLKGRGGEAAMRAVVMPPWSEQRREDLLALYQQVEGGIRPREAAVEERSRRDPVARMLATQAWGR